MSEGFGDKAKGTAEELGGKAREGMGEITGNPDISPIRSGPEGSPHGDLIASSRTFSRPGSS